MPANDMVTLDEAARELAVTRWHIRHIIYSRNIPRSYFKQPNGKYVLKAHFGDICACLPLTTTRTKKEGTHRARSK